MAKTEAAPKTTNPGKYITTGLVRLSYANLLKPKAMTDATGKPVGEPKYSVSVIVPKTETKMIAEIEAIIEKIKTSDAAKTKWGGKIPANLKIPLRDGDKEREDEAYAGAYFFNASSATQPGMVDAKLQPILDESEIYSGMWGKVSVNFYPFNTNGAKGIACGLNHVQKLKDDTPLAGRGKAEDDFEVEAEEDDDIMGTKA